MEGTYIYSLLCHSLTLLKDEAYTVWKSKWAHKYPEGHASRILLDSIINSYFLVNIVDNNYITGDVSIYFPSYFSMGL